MRLRAAAIHLKGCARSEPRYLIWKGRRAMAAFPASSVPSRSVDTGKNILSARPCAGVTAPTHSFPRSKHRIHIRLWRSSKYAFRGRCAAPGDECLLPRRPTGWTWLKRSLLGRLRQGLQRPSTGWRAVRAGRCAHYGKIPVSGRRRDAAFLFRVSKQALTQGRGRAGPRWRPSAEH